jgi:4-hydroxybenzoate polyprenyltransferase
MKIQKYLQLAYKVSRLRFWFYLTGPYTVGCIYGASSYLDLLRPWFFIYFFYFLIPANVFLYGVNDYWDYETDILNPKKEDKEYRVTLNERKNLNRINISILFFSLFLIMLQFDNIQRLITGLFVFLSNFYSAKPLRFKDKPILDSASNILYIMPGVLAYYLSSGNLPSAIVIVAGFLHTFSMHLFSAIPDIDFDKKTKIKTTAVFLGKQISLILCFILWSGLALVTITITSSPFRFLTLVYPLMTLYLIITKGKVESLYWFYPYINTGLGGLMFILKALVTPWG